jgi:hypothetical protein
VHFTVGWAALHLVLIAGVCTQDIFSLVRDGLTILPAPANAKPLATPPHLGRHVLATYLHASGIEASYGFFAPNVPDSYLLMFELRRRDGSLDYDFAKAGEREADLRLANIMDEISMTKSEQLRVILVTLLTKAMWRQHEDVVAIRAIFVRLITPLRAEPENNSYEVLFTYDFDAPPVSAPARQP